MPTLGQIQKIHDELGNRNTLGSYLRALQSIGVETYASYLKDGHSEYYCSNGKTLISDAVHELLTIADEVDKKNFSTTMELAEKDEISYIEMSKRLAESGTERWVFDTKELTITYLDKAGNTILKELV